MKKHTKRTHRKKHKNKGRNLIRLCLLTFLAVWMYLCLSLHITARPAAPAEEGCTCTLYYIVNADGMKGLGHSILLLVDGQGRGTVLSFNGMQRTLAESLAGRAGVGKMSIGKMDAQETMRFLQTGNLALDGSQLCDNYDWAVYRHITPEAYLAVLEGAQPYLQAGERFETRYQEWARTEEGAEKETLARELEQMGQDQTLPLYQIYQNNCDHAARSLAAQIDDTMQEYLLHTWHMTPSGNLKAFSHAAPLWGAVELGENSMAEKLLMFLMVF